MSSKNDFTGMSEYCHGRTFSITSGDDGIYKIILICQDYIVPGPVEVKKLSDYCFMPFVVSPDAPERIQKLGGLYAMKLGSRYSMAHVFSFDENGCINGMNENYEAPFHNEFQTVSHKKVGLMMYEYVKRGIIPTDISKWPKLVGEWFAEDVEHEFS